MSKKAIYVTGKGSDIKYGVGEMLSQKDIDVVIWDIPRIVDHISYTAIEEISNGIMFNVKYESGMVIFNPPKIIIFANIEPVLANLSMDRWVVKKID